MDIFMGPQSWKGYFGDILDKLQFSCEIAHYGKSLISLFQEFFDSFDKILILWGRLGTRLSFYEVLDFADIC